MRGDNELVDLRVKISREAWSVLKASAQRQGCELGELVREILHDHAARKIEDANLLDATLISEGLPGISGSRAGSTGSRRK